VTRYNSEMKSETYQRELRKLQVELAHLQDWVKTTGARIVIIFEGRDAAGKGGVIKRITQRVSPRVFRVVALPAPNERERTQLYLQRYIAHLPAGGEVVIFDRSWYNRAGVERVMGFCTQQQAQTFLCDIPQFEKSLIDDGIYLIKYFLTVSQDKQAMRFQRRIDDPVRHWKLSAIDLESYRRWWDYTKAYDDMLRATDTAFAPWHIVKSDNKKQARLNCIAHLLSEIPYTELPYDKPELGQRQEQPEGCPDLPAFRTYVPEKY